MFEIQIVTPDFIEEESKYDYSERLGAIYELFDYNIVNTSYFVDRTLLIVDKPLVKSFVRVPYAT